MAMLTSSANASFLPQDVGALIVRPVIAQAIATQISTVIQTGAASFRVPIVAADPSAAWTLEGAEIAPSDATLAEAVVVFKALKGLTIVSNELLADASPEAAAIIGAGLVRDISAKMDAAYFAAATPNGPAGIKSLVSSTSSAGGAWSDSDPFTEAQYAAEAVGATVNAWVANPADGLLLAGIREATGSNRGLLQPDPTQAGRRTIGGVPMYISPAVTPGEIWGVPAAVSLVVLRQDVSVAVDSSAMFTSDRSVIRAVIRCGYCFPFPIAIQRVTEA